MTDPTKPVWNRSIFALLLTTFCSAAAALVLITPLGLQIYNLTHAELSLGLIGLAEFAPSFLLVFVTGSFADRFRRVRISAASSALQAASAIGVTLYTATHPRSAAPFYALLIIFGTGRAFFAPSNRALPADIVTPLQLPWLTARRALTWQSAIIVGPIAGGFLYAIDQTLPYITSAALLTVAAASMFFVDVPQGQTAAAAEDITTEGHDVLAPKRAGLRDAVEGLRFIRRSPLLLGAISLDLFAVLFGGAVALLPALTEDRLHVGAVGLGWLRAAGGIGAAAVSLYLLRRPVTRLVGRTLLIVVSIFGVATIALGATTSYVVAFIAMAVLSGADAISVFIRSTLVPLATPNEKRGRVLAVESVFIGASNELGAFESGVAGQFLGSAGAIVLGGAATLVVAGTYWFAFPDLRGVDRFPQA